MINHMSNAQVRAEVNAPLLSFRASKLRLKFFAHCYRRENEDVQRRLIFSPKNTSGAAHPPEVWKWKTSRRPGRPRLRWADMTLREAEELAEGESLSTHELLSEMNNSNFCKVVFGRVSSSS